MLSLFKKKSLEDNNSEILIQQDVWDIKSEPSPIIKKWKKTIYIKKDGWIIEMDRSAVLYLFVIPKNKTKKPFLKELKFNFLVYVDTDREDIDVQLSEKNRESAWIEAVKNYTNTNQDKYIISQNASLSKFQYVITYNTKKWTYKKITVWSWTRQIQEYAKTLLSYYWYESIEEILLINFQKWFWESLFITKSTKTKMSAQDLFILTTKLWKQFETNPSMDTRNMLKDIILQSSAGALRNTCIKLLQIMNTSNVELPVAMEKDKENFDNVYISILKTWFQSWWNKLVESFKQLAEITQRTYYLKKALKKALKTPLIWMFFMTAVAILAAYKTVPIIEDVYSSFNTPIPTLTLTLKTIVYWLINNWYIAIVLGILTISWYNYWSNYTMYWKKFMHDLILTLPILWNFMKTRDYEIFASIASMLWPIWNDPKIILDSLKQVVTNYHFSWVINTAWILWSETKTSPWQVFEKFPMYVDPKIANAFKWEWSPDAELKVLARIYKSDNDDFIDNLEKILEPLLMVFVVLMLWFIIFSVVIPLYWVVNIAK